MAAHARIPVILPLSNPTSKTEAEPEDILEWTRRSRDRRDRQPLPSRDTR